MYLSAHTPEHKVPKIRYWSACMVWRYVNKKWN